MSHAFFGMLMKAQWPCGRTRRIDSDAAGIKQMEKKITNSAISKL